MMYGQFFYVENAEGYWIGPYKRKEDIPEELEGRVRCVWEDDEHYYVYRPDGSAEGPYERIDDIPNDVEGEVMGIPRDVFYNKNTQYRFEFEEDDGDWVHYGHTTDLRPSVDTSDITSCCLFGLDGKLHGPFKSLDDLPPNTPGFVLATGEENQAFWINDDGEWEYRFEMIVHRRRSDTDEEETASVTFEPTTGRSVE